MESILKSDIFFFITSIAVIILTLALLTALYYFIRMMMNFYKISKVLRCHVESTEQELHELGSHIRQSPLFTFFFGKEKVKNDSEKHYKKSI